MPRQPCFKHRAETSPTLCQLPGFVLIDDDGLWVKINQWSQGLYERRGRHAAVCRSLQFVTTVLVRCIRTPSVTE